MTFGAGLCSTAPTSLTAVVDVALLRGIGFFQSFGPEALGELAEHTRARTFHRGDTLFAEGDQAHELFIVGTGRIAISNRSPDGRESIVALMGPGDIFGEMSLFDGLGRSAGARALELSTLTVTPFEPVRAKFGADPGALWNVVALLARRLRGADEALADSVFLDVTGRTAKRLLEIAGSNDEFQIPVTQEELAGMIGASRERVNKAIASFIRLGWIDQLDRMYRILDRRKLTNRAH